MDKLVAAAMTNLNKILFFWNFQYEKKFQTQKDEA